MIVYFLNKLVAAFILLIIPVGSLSNNHSNSYPVFFEDDIIYENSIPFYSLYSNGDRLLIKVSYKYKKIK